jgi:alkaline phosphatase D
MKKGIFAGVFLGLLTQGASATLNASKLQSVGELKSFAFGSCNSTRKYQPLWNYIAKDSPQLFIWAGDNIYADTSDPKVIQQKYDIQNSLEEYQSLKDETPIIGIWDDHDYGYDNATWNNPMKHISQQMFLDFIEEPTKSARRSQQGIYTSYTFGPQERQIKFILLDNRFHLGAPGKDTAILGKEQWNWFEKEITNSKAKIHFIVAGLSVLSPRIPKTEEWADHPAGLNKMLRLLRKHNPSGVVFLTGDKHMSSIFQRHGFLEFMNSGMTHTAPRILRPIVRRYYPLSFFGLTYGLVNLDWDGDIPRLQLQIKTTRKSAVFTKNYKLNKRLQWFETQKTSKN